VTTATYDGMGRQTSATYPAAGGLPAETVSTGYAGAYPSGLSSPAATYVASTSYTGIGQVASQVLGVAGALGSVRRTATWDPGTGQLTNEAAVTPSTGSVANVQNDAYTYSPTGDVTKATDQTVGQQQCYTYDGSDRLVAAATSAASSATGNGCTADTTVPTPYNDAYAYDADGNLTSLVHGGATTSYGYGTNTSRSLSGGPHAPTTATTATATSTYTYDANGQLAGRTAAGVASTYTWDPQGDLTSITAGGSTSSFAYGPDGTRWVRTTPAETVVYLDGQELHLATGATTPTVVRSYTQAGTTIAVRKTGTGGGLFWMLTDRQNSATVAVNAVNGTFTRDRYLPFGGDRATTSTGSPLWTMPSDRGWLGKTQDSTGLDYLGARYYDPTLAHFISADPLNDQTTPQSANPYAYAADNPITNSDPTGLAICASIPEDLGACMGQGVATNAAAALAAKQRAAATLLLVKQRAAAALKAALNKPKPAVKAPAAVPAPVPPICSKACGELPAGLGPKRGGPATLDGVILALGVAEVALVRLRQIVIDHFRLAVWRL
jgi:RHS repeat-associated protein